MQISPPHRGWQWREADGWYAETHTHTPFNVKNTWKTEKKKKKKKLQCVHSVWVNRAAASPPRFHVAGAAGTASGGSSDGVLGTNRAFFLWQQSGGVCAPVRAH